MVVVEKWWYWKSGGSGGCDNLCKGSSCNSCRSTKVKCSLCGGSVGGGGGGGYDVGGGNCGWGGRPLMRKYNFYEHHQHHHY